MARISSIGLYWIEGKWMITLLRCLHFPSWKIDFEPGRRDLLTLANRASSRGVESSPFFERKTTGHTIGWLSNEVPRV